jgi:hypothetical protein
MAERIGYVVVTWNQASGWPELDYSDLHAYRDDAERERDSKREQTASSGRGEMHKVAEVVELEDDGGV